MCIGFIKTVVARVDHICQAFLWGSHDDDRPRLALVAWARLQLPKLQGGLALHDSYI